MSPTTVTVGLTPRERERFKQACRRGYLVDTSRRRVNLANCWWTYCERADRPYIRVIRRHRSDTASITVDLLPMRAVFPETTVAKFRSMWAEHAVPGSAFFPGHNWVGFCKLPVEAVEALMPSICRIAQREAVLEERVA